MRHIAKQHPQIATKIGKQKATFTHVFLKLSDDNYVFLQRSNHFATDLKVSFVGGSFTAGQSLIDHKFPGHAKLLGDCEQPDAPGGAAQRRAAGEHGQRHGEDEREDHRQQPKEEGWGRPIKQPTPELLDRKSVV